MDGFTARLGRPFGNDGAAYLEYTVQERQSVNTVTSLDPNKHHHKKSPVNDEAF